jgi:hypothetical protein
LKSRETDGMTSLLMSKGTDVSTPRRALTAYNLFFQLERQRLIDGEEERDFSVQELVRLVIKQRQLRNEPKPKRKHRKAHGKIGFAELARTVAAKWKKLHISEKAMFEDCAIMEKQRYAQEKKEKSTGVNTQLIQESTSPGPHATEYFPPRCEISTDDDPTGLHMQPMTQGFYQPSQAFIQHRQANMDEMMRIRLQLARFNQVANATLMDLARNDMPACHIQTPHVASSLPYNESTTFYNSNLNDVYNMADNAYSFSERTWPPPRYTSVQMANNDDIGSFSDSCEVSSEKVYNGRSGMTSNTMTGHDHSGVVPQHVNERDLHIFDEDELSMF